MYSEEWPFNLWLEVLKPEIKEHPDEYKQPEDTLALYVKNLDMVLSEALTERELKAVHMRYEQHMKYREVGAYLGVSTARAKQICGRAQQKLRNPEYYEQLRAVPETEYLRLARQVYTLSQEKSNLEAEIQYLSHRLEVCVKELEKPKIALDSSVDVLNLSARSHTRLIENGILTVSDLLDCTPSFLMGIRGMGKMCINEINRSLALYDLKLSY